MNYYSRYFKRLQKDGMRINSRGMPATAEMNVTFATSIGKTYRRPGDNPLIGFMEGLQFIGGYFNLDQIKRIAPHARLDLFGPSSAYGSRVGVQFYEVVNVLREDPDSRRAVIALAQPDEPLETRPCTSSLQFLQVDKKVLYTIVTMRSSDAVWGLPYDLIQFSMMSDAVASCLGWVAGTITINIGNAHVYDATVNKGMGWKPWRFTVPYNGTDPYKWTDWAREEAEIIDLPWVMNEYRFREVKED